MCSITFVSAVAAAEKTDNSVVIVLGGDLGLGGSGQPISAKGGYRHGRLIAWNKLTQGIRPLLNGDLNFANLETVVTNKARLRATEKAFNFRMHAAGVRHLVSAGFNVLSTANNHAIDYGQTGMRETMRHLKLLENKGLFAFPGLGHGREAALAPATFKLKGHRIAVSAIGIGGPRVPTGSKRYGQISYRNRQDFDDVLSVLSQAKESYRVLSVHYGQELQIRPSSSAITKLRDRAVLGAGVDLVVGHHAHVAAGVQMVDGKVIFYGLGNLLHLGMQDMAKFSACRDYGLLARVYLSPQPGGQLKVYAIQVIPLTAMHSIARPMKRAWAVKRIGVLNGLASALDDRKADAAGIRFRPQADATGLYCLPDAHRLGGRIGALCQGWRPISRQARGVNEVPVHRCGASSIVDHRRRRRLEHADKTRRLTRRGRSRRLIQQERSSSKHRGFKNNLLANAVDP